MCLRWELFADILKVGVPGLINTAITNLSVVVLTGIAGQFGPEAAIGYAMGARLDTSCSPSLSASELPSLRWWGRTGERDSMTGRVDRLDRAGTIAVVCGMLGFCRRGTPVFGWALFSDNGN